jgi:hypothetical protein
VKGLEHDQRDCASDMENLLNKMLAARGKMESVDKWIAKNISDAIAIAQNTDATPENPTLASTGDKYPGIKDKMIGAQNDISGFLFGTAGAKQKGVETGLERVITVLGRRRETDYKKTLDEIKESMRELSKSLEEQRRLTQDTKNIQNKEDLQRQLGQARQQLSQIREQQEKLKNQTEKYKSSPTPRPRSSNAPSNARGRNSRSSPGIRSRSSPTRSRPSRRPSRPWHARSMSWRTSSARNASW